MAATNKPAKIMSSRLSTMKFMQRAGASSPSTPSPSEPPSKKQRLSSGPINLTPTSTSGSDVHNAGVMQRHNAIDRAETNWVLSLQEPPEAVTETPLHIVSAGYSRIDMAREQSSDNEESGRARNGRRTFGKFKRAVTNPGVTTPNEDDEDENESDADGNESDDPTGAKAMIAQARREAGEKARQERQAKRKFDAADSQRMAEARRRGQVKLNGADKMPNGISSGGRNTDITCHRCGKPGHMMRDCPQATKQTSRNR